MSGLGSNRKYRMKYIYVYIWKGALLEWLTGCGPLSPKMAIYQWKVQESNSWLIYKAGYLSWFALYTRRTKAVSEGVTCQQEKADKQPRYTVSPPVEHCVWKGRLLGVVVRTCEPCSLEVEAGGSGVQGSLKLCELEPEASLKYTRSYLRETTKQKQKKRRKGKEGLQPLPL